ncbi:hypothetical protein P280DRAFT_477302 [Massarina eburnea CBS 473.64]|uniref:Uncharacterized protein n=1 Tax=Massarina eburnea CBS 473.64 TaxID=1395130 RepID=A0A6A6S831_9PLEO|nr:hypothetical protein P280DRAFT_477302 [Massarina eburnea CBS 473.64]
MKTMVSRRVQYFSIWPVQSLEAIPEEEESSIDARIADEPRQSNSLALSSRTSTEPRVEGDHTLSYEPSEESNHAPSYEPSVENANRVDSAVILQELAPNDILDPTTQPPTSSGPSSPIQASLTRRLSTRMLGSFRKNRKSTSKAIDSDEKSGAVFVPVPLPVIESLDFPRFDISTIAETIWPSRDVHELLASPQPHSIGSQSTSDDAFKEVQFDATHNHQLLESPKPQLDHSQPMAENSDMRFSGLGWDMAGWYQKLDRLEEPEHDIPEYSTSKGETFGFFGAYNPSRTASLKGSRQARTDGFRQQRNIVVKEEASTHEQRYTSSSLDLQEAHQSVIQEEDPETSGAAPPNKQAPFLETESSAWTFLDEGAFPAGYEAYGSEEPLEQALTLTEDDQQAAPQRSSPKAPSLRQSSPLTLSSIPRRPLSGYGFLRSTASSAAKSRSPVYVPSSAPLQRGKASVSSNPKVRPPTSVSSRDRSDSVIPRGRTPRRSSSNATARRTPPNLSTPAMSSHSTC